MLFRGLSAFPITPADPQGRVDTSALAHLLERLADARVHSVGLLGSTGTYAYLSRTERRRAIAACVECLDGRIPVIAGIGALRTDEAQALAQDAQSEGADGLLLAPVSYTPLTDTEVYEHFAAVCQVTDLPLCIYNNPSTTNFRFGPTLIESLAKLPNVAGIKMPLPIEQECELELESLRQKTPEGFSIGYSGDWGCAKCLLSGADAWYSVVGGTFPHTAMKLVTAVQNEDRHTVQRVDESFQPLWELFQEFGSLRVVYAAANILSLIDAAPPLPLLPLPSNIQQRVETAIEAIEVLEKN